MSVALLEDRTKQCTKCKRILPVAAFYVDHHGASKDGVRGICKECMRSYGKKQRKLRRKERRVRQAAYYKRHTEIIQLRAQNYRAANLQRLEAYRTITRTRQQGLLMPEPCADCGLPAKYSQAHHEDYSRPLEVIWLCPSCHMTRHQKHNQVAI